MTKIPSRIGPRPPRTDTNRPPTNRPPRNRNLEKQKVNKPTHASGPATHDDSLALQELEVTSMEEMLLDEDVAREEIAQEFAQQDAVQGERDEDDDAAKKELDEHEERVNSKDDALLGLDPKHEAAKQNLKEKPAEPPKAKDDFEQKKADPLTQRMAEFDKASAVMSTKALSRALAEGAERKSDKPPDAMQLLHQAQPPGVYFKEDDWNRAGDGQSGLDPELAAALEEARRLLAEVKGVDRVTTGKNMEEESVIVVVTAKGFTEASLRAVPERVHRFATLLAIPYDILPLRRERAP